MTTGQITIDRYIYPENYDMPEEFIEVIHLFEKYRANEFRFLQEAAMFLARRNGQVTADDLYALCNYVGINKDRRILGGVLGNLKRKGLLKPLKIVRTSRKESHGRLIWIFVPVEVRE